MHHSKITLNFHHSNGAVRLRFLPLAFGCANHVPLARLLLIKMREKVGTYYR